MFNNTNNAEQSAKTPMRWTLKVYFKKWRKLLHDDQASADFSNAIKDGDLTSMKEMLEDPAIKAKINPSYQNEDGDTFLHLAVKQGRWDYVTPVNNLGCVNYIKNNAGELPFDLARGCFKDVVGNAAPNILEAKKQVRNAFVEDLAHHHREDFFGAVFPGKRVVDDLGLYFDDEDGHCEMPDAWPELNDLDYRQLSLHSRLSIANHLSSARAVNVEGMSPDASVNCYVTAAMTLVLTEKPIADNVAPYKLKAVTAPINVPGYMVYTSGEAYAHAETILFKYLNDGVVLSRLVSDIKSIAGIDTGHKCYGIVFDMNVTYNMCDGCESNLYALLSDRAPDSFMLKLETAIESSGLILPAEKKHINLQTPVTSRIFFTPRISCKTSSNYSQHKDANGYPYLVFDGATSHGERNVAKHHNAVIFHTPVSLNKKSEKYSFSKDSRGDYPPCYVPNQTAFLMKPDKDRSRSRHQAAVPVLFSAVLKEQDPSLGLFIERDSSSRIMASEVPKPNN